MYDFGYDPAAGQVSPIEIVFGVVFYNGEYRIYYDYAGDGFDVGDLLAENRIYIAQVDIAPEPLTVALLGLGGLGLLRSRIRRKRA
jgi:hypothetical protein